jgi:hypothetical protein
MIQEYEYMLKIKTVSWISPHFRLQMYVYVKYKKVKSITVKAQVLITNNNNFSKKIVLKKYQFQKLRKMEVSVVLISNVVHLNDVVTNKARVSCRLSESHVGSRCVAVK